MENIQLKRKQDIALEVLLIEAGVKECDHKHTYKDHCFVCKQSPRKFRG